MQQPFNRLSSISARKAAQEESQNQGQPLFNSPEDNSVGVGNTLGAGTVSGSTRDATSFLGNPVFTGGISELQQEADSRIADYNTLEDLKIARQSNWERAGNALGGGLAAGAFRAADAVAQLLPFGREDGFMSLPGVISSDFSERSVISNYLSESAKAIQAQTPIYNTNPYNFWAGVQAATTSMVEFALPALLIRGGMKGVGRAAGAGTRGVSRGLSSGIKKGLPKTKLATRARAAETANKLDDFLTNLSKSPTNKQLFQSIPAGALQNRLEGTIMGHQVYEETLAELEQAVSAGQLTREEAEDFANDAAQSVRLKNSAMILTDIFAMHGILKAKGFTRNVRNKPGFLGTMRSKLFNTKIWNPLKREASQNLFYQSLVEGAEEVIQSQMQAESTYNALGDAEKLAYERVGDQELVYTAGADNYYERLKENIFSEGALFEGLIGFFSGGVQTQLTETGFGIKPVLDRRKYSNYTKEIEALKKELKPGGSAVTPIAKQKIKDQIANLELKRAQETEKGAYEAQQQVLAQVKNDVKEAFKRAVTYEDLIEDVQKMGIDGVEEFLNDKEFLNVAIKHFQEGTTEALERHLTDIINGEVQDSSLGPDSKEKAAAMLEELLTLEKEWTRYYDYVGSEAIFGLTQNRKNAVKAKKTIEEQVVNKQAAVIERLNEYDRTNTYSFNAEGKLQATPKSKEELEADQTITKEQIDNKKSIDDIRKYMGTLNEYSDLTNARNHLFNFDERISTMDDTLIELKSSKGQAELKKAQDEAVKRAKDAAKRAMATQKSEAGKRSEATTKAEKSSIENTRKKIDDDNIKVKSDKEKASGLRKGRGKKDSEKKESAFAEGVSIIEQIKARRKKGGKKGKESQESKKGKGKEEVVLSDTPQEAYSKKGDRSNSVMGRTQSNDEKGISDTAFWKFSDPSSVKEGDKISFNIEGEAGVAFDPGLNRQGTVAEAQLRAEEIANHENETYGSSIDSDQALEDIEAIEILMDGEVVGYVASPLSITSETRKDATEEELLEEKEKLRAIRAEILARKQKGMDATATISSIETQYIQFAESIDANNVASEVYGDEVVIGIPSGGNIVFEGGSSTIEATGKAKKAVIVKSYEELKQGLAYAFIPLKVDKNGTVYYYPAALFNQPVTSGHVNTMLYGLLSWAGRKEEGGTGMLSAISTDPLTEKASETLNINLNKPGIDRIALFLRRYVQVSDSHLGRGKAYIYTNHENDSIEFYDEEGTIRASFSKDKVPSDQDIAAAEAFLSGQNLNFTLENLQAASKNEIKFVITERDGTLVSETGVLDYRKYILENSIATVLPVPGVKAATGKNVYQQAPLVKFVLDVKDGKQSTRPQDNSKNPKIKITASKRLVAKAVKLGFTEDMVDAMTTEERDQIRTATSAEDVKELLNKFTAPTVSKTREQLAKELEDATFAGDVNAIKAAKKALEDFDKSNPPETITTDDVIRVGDTVSVNTKKGGISTVKEDRGDKVLLSDGRQVGKNKLTKENPAIVNGDQTDEADHVDPDLQDALDEFEDNPPFDPNYDPSTGEISVPENLGDITPEDFEDDLPGEELSEESKKDLDDKRIPGLTARQKRETVDYAFRLILQKLTERLGRRIESEAAAQEALDTIVADTRAYIQRFKDQLEKETVKASPQKTAQINSVINGLETFITIVTSPEASTKIKAQALEKVKQATGVFTERSEEDLSSVEELAPERRSYSEDFYLTLDPKKTTSRLLRTFLSTLIETEVREKTNEQGEVVNARVSAKRTFFGSPKYANFDDVYNKLHSLEVGSSPNLNKQLESLMRLYVEYPGLRSENAWIPHLVYKLGGIDLDMNISEDVNLDLELLQQFIEASFGKADVLGPVILDTQTRGKFIDQADSKTRNQFAANMAKAKVTAPLVLYSLVTNPNTGRKTLRTIVTDHNSVDAIAEIQDGFEQGMLNKLFNYDPVTNDYTKNDDAFERAIKFLEDLAKNPPTEKDTAGYKQLRAQFLEILGLDLSVDTFKNLSKTGIKSDGIVLRLNKLGRAKETLFSNKAGVFRALQENLKKFSVENKPFNVDNNPFSDTSIKRLAKIEALSATAKVSNSFTVGDKTIYTYSEHHFLSSQLERLMDPVYRDQLSETLFAQDSLWLHLMSAAGNNLISTDRGIDTVPGIKLGVLNFRPIKEFKESNVTTKDADEQIDDENYFTRTSLFFSNSSARNKQIAMRDKDGKIVYQFLGHSVREATMSPITNSDKSNVPTVTTSTPIFTLTGGDRLGVDTNTIELFYTHVLLPEIKRIELMDGLEANDSAYEKGMSYFHLMPEMNFVEIDGKSVREHIIDGDLDLIKDKLKTELGNQLNELIAETEQEMQERGINKKTPESDATFIPDAYMELLKGVYKNNKKELPTNLNRAIAADYALSNMLAAANMFQLFAKDIALYSKGSPGSGTEQEVRGFLKATRDNVQKRLAAMTAPGTAQAEDVGNDKYIQIFANDIKYVDFAPEIKNFYKNLPESVREAYYRADITDAQELLTVNEYLSNLVGAGAITEEEKKRIITVTNDASKDLEPWMEEILFGAEKPVAVVNKLVTIEGGEVTNDDGTVTDLKIEKEYYIKSSGVPLIPRFTKGTKLDEIRKAMEQVEKTTGLPVRLGFKSGVKLGFPKSAEKTSLVYTQEDIDYLRKEIEDTTKPGALRDKKIEDLESKLGKVKDSKDLFDVFMGTLTDQTLDSKDPYSFDASVQAPMQIFDRKYWRIQQATPNKNKDESTNGTQENKIIPSEVMEAFGEKKGNEILNKWNETYAKLIDLRTYKIEKEILGPDGSIDPNKLAKFLDRELSEGGVDENISYGLQIGADGKFIIPLDLSPGSPKYQAMINAIASKNIAKKKSKGQSTVLMTEFGFEINKGSIKDSGIIFTSAFDMEYGMLKPARMEGDVAKPAQVFLPNKFFINGKKVDLRKYTTKDDNGAIILDPKKVPQEILKGMGFRIPTQGYNSISPVEIAGFLPEEMGDIVVAPASFVTQMGSDFDIDKLYNYFYKLQKGKNGVLEKADKPSLKDSSFTSLGKKDLELLEDMLLNDALDLRLEIMASKHVFNQMVKPLDFGYLKYSAGDGTELSAPGVTVAMPDGSTKTFDEIVNSSEGGLKSFYELEGAKFNKSMSNPLSPVYQTSRYSTARGAKSAIGVFARVITFNSMIQSSRESVTSGINVQLGKLNGTTLSNNNVLSGRKNIDGTVRTKTQVATAILSAALDNENEQIMNALNINNFTFKYISPLILLGFEEDHILAFVESAVLKMLAGQEQSRTKAPFSTTNAYQTKNDLYKSILKSRGLEGVTGDELKEAMMQITEDAEITLSGDSSESVEGTLSRMLKENRTSMEYVPESKTILFKDSEGNPLEGKDLENARLYALGILNIATPLQAVNTTILGAQRILNTDSVGLGNSAHNVYSQMEDFVGTAFDVDEVGNLIPQPKGTIGYALVGEPTVVPALDKEADIKKRKDYLKTTSELQDKGYIRIGKQPGQPLEYWLKPKTPAARVFARSMSLTTKIYEEHMGFLVDTVIPNSDTISKGAIPVSDRFSMDPAAKTKLAEEIVKSTIYSKPSLWLSNSFAKDVLNLPDNYTARDLRDALINSGDSSLANIVKAAREDSRAAINDNEFLKSLITDTPKGKHHSVFYSAYAGDNLMESDKGDAFIELFTTKDQSPIAGTNITPAQLGTMLVAYAFATGGVQKAVQFVKIIPTKYLEKTGFYAALKQEMEDTLSSIERSNVLINTAALQTIQHNPKNAFEKRRNHSITLLDSDKNTYVLSGKGVKVISSLEGFSELVIGKSFVSYIYQTDKKGRVSLFRFSPTLSSEGEAVLEKIDVLGAKGISEYSLGQETGVGYTSIPENRSDYISQEERESVDDETEDLLKKIRATKKTPKKTSVDLKLPTSGETNILNPLAAIALSSSNPMYRSLATAFLTKEELLKGITFSVKQLGPEAVKGRGKYNHQDKSINISYTGDRLDTEYTLLHEVGHAFTKNVIDTYERSLEDPSSTPEYINPEVKSAIENLAKIQSAYVEYIKLLSPDGFEAFKEKYNTYRENKTKEEKDKIPVGFSKEEISKYYGALKLSEFVTMVLSDEQLQRELDQVIPTLEVASSVGRTKKLKSLFKDIVSQLTRLIEAVTGIKLSEFAVQQAMLIVSDGKFSVAPVIEMEETTEEEGEGDADIIKRIKSKRGAKGKKPSPAKGKSSLFTWDSKSKREGNSNQFGFLEKVISGGQTGADIRGLEAAAEMGYAVGGVGTSGLASISSKAAEFGVEDFDNVKLTKEESDYINSRLQSTWTKPFQKLYNPRTYLNINRSDATVIYVPDGATYTDSSGKLRVKADKSAGSFLTEKIARDLKKPVIINPSPKELNKFLLTHKPKVLNIAGSGQNKFGKDNKAQNIALARLRDAIKLGITTTAGGKGSGKKVVNRKKSTKPTGTTGQKNKTYKGKVTTLKDNQVYVFGANDQGLHGKGGAGSAMDEFRTLTQIQAVPDGTVEKWAIKGRTGLMQGREGRSYGLITVEGTIGGKNEDNRIPEETLIYNIKQLYKLAESTPDQEYLIAYNTAANMKSLNGYKGKEMADLFAKAGPIPDNIVFNDRFNTLVRAGEPVAEKEGQTATSPGVEEFVSKYGQQEYDKINEGLKKRSYEEWIEFFNTGMQEAKGDPGKQKFIADVRRMFRDYGQMVIGNEDDLPGSDITVAEPSSVDLGGDIVEFLSTLAPGEKRFYTRLIESGEIKVSCKLK